MQAFVEKGLQLSGTSGKCLQRYRLGPPQVHSASPCDMALDVVMDRTAKLSIEADILAFDPYKVTARGSPPRWCYVHGYMGYDQEDFQDMNLVTRRGTNWHPANQWPGEIHRIRGRAA